MFFVCFLHCVRLQPLSKIVAMSVAAEGACRDQVLRDWKCLLYWELWFQGDGVNPCCLSFLTDLSSLNPGFGLCCWCEWQSELTEVPPLWLEENNGTAGNKNLVQISRKRRAQEGNFAKMFVKSPAHCWFEEESKSKIKYFPFKKMSKIIQRKLKKGHNKHVLSQ